MFLTGPIPMEIHVTLEGRGDLSARIYRQLLDAILDGRLRPGARLPPTRELARRLDVSRNTVPVAYASLTADGVVSARIGAGTYVSAEPIPAAHARHAPAGTGVQPRPLWKLLPAPATPTKRTTAPCDFGVGSPDVRLFPFMTWRRLVAHEVRPGSLRWETYGDPAGHAGLRAAIARHVGVSRTVQADADDVIVTQGAQQAFDLIG